MPRLYHYWVVWNESHGSPTVKHNTRDKAFAEAERLATVHPRDKFAVLECVGECRKQAVVWDYPEEFPELSF